MAYHAYGYTQADRVIRRVRQIILVMSQQQLDYASSRARPNRGVSFLLLLVQLNAAIVMVFAAIAFWWTVIKSIVFFVPAGGFPTPLVKGILEASVPFMLACGVWTLCSIRRRLGDSAAT